MYKLCKTEESAKRQREIELCLLSMMKTRKYEDITISELCDTNSIPRKAFYRYFENKDGALHALIVHTVASYEEVAKNYKSAQRTLEGDLEKFFKFWRDQQDFLDALKRNNLIGLLIQYSISYSETEREILNKFLPGEPEQMQRAIIKFAICGLMSSMAEWHEGGFQQKSIDMARTMCRMFSKPLFPNLSAY
ncbi:MAG: TetR/AcrR family transcriptional regulator [Clostridia bacterium]|nr:TetR/AcrR family transcriptional regulator [Clostridia bacterium]